MDRKVKGAPSRRLDDVVLALDAKEVSTQTRIRLRYDGKLINLENERDSQDIIKATPQDVRIVRFRPLWGPRHLQ